MRLSYAEYGERIEALARGFVRAGVKPAEVIAIYLPNSWEFAAAYHAATLAGAIPTLLNPSYREREVQTQLRNSGAVLLIADGSNVSGMNFAGATDLRAIYSTRQCAVGTLDFQDLLRDGSPVSLPSPAQSSRETLAALPYSSGTTGLPKGVMLSHFNLVANIYQYLAPEEFGTYVRDEVILGFLPLYHIYGLNVVLNPALLVGATIVLMPRFDVKKACDLIAAEGVTFMPMVPPVMNAICNAAEQGLFPREHRLRAVKSGAAPLPAELPRRFTRLTGVPVRQGYGMTEASPVTHLGYFEEALYRPDSIGHPLAQTEAKIVDANGNPLSDGEPGELIMRGPQFMLGYWNNPAATNEALRDGWYWSGDIAVRDDEGFFRILDRRKELIKYKGFPVAPAEIEGVLLDHPAVADCGVIGVPDDDAGEVACAFVVLKNSATNNGSMENELRSFVAAQLSTYKRPKELRFVQSISRTPSGKILRRELREML